MSIFRLAAYTWSQAFRAFLALMPIPLADACLMAYFSDSQKYEFRYNVDGFRTFMRLWMLIGLVPIYAFVPVMWALWRTLAPYAWQVGEIAKVVIR